MTQKGNIYSYATIVKSDPDNEISQLAYKLNDFLNNNKDLKQTKTENIEVKEREKEREKKEKEEFAKKTKIVETMNSDLLKELKELKSQMQNIETKIVGIEENGTSAKDLDKQVVEAIKDLKNYASFFEQATFQLESKMLKTSISIAKKIISIEVGENSSAIAKETIKNLLARVKTASKIQIHLNPKDYIVLKTQLKLNSFIELHEDSNVAAGGVVIASDLGNFDGNIEAKVNTMLESLENVI